MASTSARLVGVSWFIISISMGSVPLPGVEGPVPSVPPPWGPRLLLMLSVGLGGRAHSTGVLLSFGMAFVMVNECICTLPWLVRCAGGVLQGGWWLG